MKSFFWNKKEVRLRAFFRIVALVLLTGILANLISLLADGLSEPLEKSILNFLIMLVILVSIYLIGKFVDKREWADFGITLVPLQQFFYGGLLGAVLVIFIFSVHNALQMVSEFLLRGKK